MSIMDQETLFRGEYEEITHYLKSWIIIGYGLPGRELLGSRLALTVVVRRSCLKDTEELLQAERRRLASNLNRETHGCGVGSSIIAASGCKMFGVSSCNSQM